MIGELPVWHNQASCVDVDPECFWPEPGEFPSGALAVCNGSDLQPVCPVRGECLEWALVNREHEGVWGGTTPNERRMLRQRRAS